MFIFNFLLPCFNIRRVILEAVLKSIHRACCLVFFQFGTISGWIFSWVTERTKMIIRILKIDGSKKFTILLTSRINMIILFVMLSFDSAELINSAFRKFFIQTNWPNLRLVLIWLLFSNGKHRLNLVLGEALFLELRQTKRMLELRFRWWWRSAIILMIIDRWAYTLKMINSRWISMGVVIDY